MLSDMSLCSCQVSSHTFFLGVVEYETCCLQGWPVNEPDIIVSTPAALLNNINAFDPEKQRRSKFLRGVKCVVNFFSESFKFILVI